MLCICIVTYNSKRTLPACLASLNKSSLPDAMRMIVVDNNSTDGTAPLLHDIEKAGVSVLFNTANIGFARAANQAIEFATKRFGPAFFLLLNPDAIVEPDCIEKLTSYAMRHPSIGLVSPKIVNSSTNSIWFAGGQIHWLRFKTRHVTARLRASRNMFFGFSSYLSGCCLLVSKQLYKKIGGLDERFFLYYEDADYSIRAQQAGFGIAVVKDALCYHLESFSSTSEQKIQHLVASGLLFFHKHYPRFFLPYFWATYFTRLMYHRYISGKTEVYEAMKCFVSLSDPKK